jgi:two-component system chemotaxis response regulator CheB
MSPGPLSDQVRVLVVDDSAGVRSMLVRILETETSIKVVGTVGDGFRALEAVEKLHPDVVTLDVEMPGMDGREFLKRVRLTHPRLPIIMFSHLTQRGAVSTVDALFMGATDFVGKPSYMGSADAAREQIRVTLVPKILALKGAIRSEIPRSAPRTPKNERQPAAERAPAERPATAERAPAAPKIPMPAIVAIGSSTGGPVALDEVLCSLPRDFPLAVVVVQHMPPSFIPLLADRMSARSRIPVMQAEAGAVVTAGKVLLAPGDKHMSVKREGSHVSIELFADPLRKTQSSVDVLFKSVAKAYGSAALGVVLTGMGQEGLEGSRAIVEAGGRVIVQDEQSSVVWGMPGSVAKAGLAQAILSVKDIGPDLVARARHAP